MLRAGPSANPLEHLHRLMTFLGLAEFTNNHLIFMAGLPPGEDKVVVELASRASGPENPDRSEVRPGIGYAASWWVLLENRKGSSKGSCVT